MAPPRSAYLTLDELAADPALVRRLSADLAWRYHALPLAEDQGCITVAMADPGDAEARKAVMSVLGPGACVVKGSPLTIDTRLAEIWGSEARCPLQLKVGTYPTLLPDWEWDYAQALVGLLGAQLQRVDITDGEADPVGQAIKAHCDLIVTGETGQPLVRKLLSQAPSGASRSHKQGLVPFAILVAQRPRWPVWRILLLICGDAADSAGIEWALRLATSSQAAVTALTVVPPVPAMYGGLPGLTQDLPSLLATDTALGRHLRQVARRMTECRVEGTLRLRQGTLDHQIARELEEGDHDLVIAATRPCRWWLRSLKGDPICALIRRLDRPLLLTEAMAG
jgi:nucleotide-binding universal stress UspA family protein